MTITALPWLTGLLLLPAACHDSTATVCPSAAVAGVRVPLTLAAGWYQITAVGDGGASTVWMPAHATDAAPGPQRARVARAAGTWLDVTTTDGEVHLTECWRAGSDGGCAELGPPRAPITLTVHHGGRAVAVLTVDATADGVIDVAGCPRLGYGHPR
jgi:hypothetical protein